MMLFVREKEIEGREKETEDKKGGGRSKEGEGQLPASVFPAAARGPALRLQVWFNALLSGS